MLTELNLAAKYFKDKFKGNPPPVGAYPVPYEKNGTTLYMKVVINEKGKMGGFDLYHDEAFEKKWSRGEV